MAKFHIHNTAKIGALSDRQINDLAAELSTMTLENDLRRQLQVEHPKVARYGHLQRAETCYEFASTRAENADTGMAGV